MSEPVEAVASFAPAIEPKPKKRPQVWRVKGYPGGIWSRGGWCRFRWSRREYSPQIEFHPSRRGDAEAAYVRWYRVQAGFDVPMSGAPVRWLKDAVEQFERDRYPTLTKKAKKNYTSAFTHFFVRNVPMVDAAVYRLLLEQDVADAPAGSPTHLAQSTRSVYLSHIKALLSHAIDLSWLRTADGSRPEVNPVDLLLRHRPVDRSRTRAISAPSARDVVKIIQYLRTHNAPDYALAIKLLARTGMRGAELIHALREDITDAGILIIGKGSIATIEDMSLEERRRYCRTHDVTKRWIPLRAIPGVRRLIDQLLAYEPEHPARRARTRSGYLVGWESMRSLSEAYTRARDAVGVSEAHTIHSLRRFALSVWENAYSWPPDIRADIAGHDEDVAKASYRVGPTPEQLLQRIDRAASGASVGQIR
jgi:integrase